MNGSTKSAVVALLLTANLANAGTVVLENDRWNYISEVEVTKGINAPNTNISRYTGVTLGWSTSATDKLCYRRAQDPRRPGGGMTGWTCVHKMTSGVSTESLH